MKTVRAVRYTVVLEHPEIGICWRNEYLCTDGAEGVESDLFGIIVRGLPDAFGLAMAAPRLEWSCRKEEIQIQA